jgi:hypothetical protein
MFRHELSPFLQRVLGAVERLPDGVMVDSHFEPDPRHVKIIAAALGEACGDVRGALIGLQAAHCLTQEPLDIPGIDPLYMWRVHPQCAAASATSDDRM